ncbi:hypothetical protein H8S90_24800 [Olivibacter sp. SDN3]|uniref:hypothetical protein n=1 Tax=Olivibacter sp. SDN3 TaxID=2764720 RepID=UPI001651AA0A|nr:hypothetical protein [Olivibacter sp. SDN3]QNL49875.1 hypothetical protein H8S90_24800 [Olivibacter sp. SDN3]
MNKYLFVYFNIFLLWGLLYSCSKDQAASPEPEPPEGNEVTVENVSYNNFVGALFESKCGSCHASGGGASGRWTFSGYTSVRDNASRINNVVLVTRTMPIGGTLTTNERSLLQAWFDRNTPED